MKLLTTLFGLLVVTGKFAANSMPPFMLLSPPKFKAGHTTNLKLVLFTGNSGNLTVIYHNETTSYYNRETRTEHGILMNKTFDITEEDSIIDIPVEVPEKLVGTHILTYTGYMEGYGRFEFGGSSIAVRSTGYKSYVQTDKPIYKPGQPVRFRGFSIDSHLKGLTLSEGLTVKIMNPNGIVVFDEIIFNNGSIIHQGTFLLAEEATIGQYTISVTGKNSASCSFSVEEYVLPKFGVEIEGPGSIAADDTVVRGKVTATYTYGKPVNGQAVLKFAVDNKSQKMYSGAYHFREITVDLVDGKADWEVDITDLTTRKLRYLFNPFCSTSTLVISASVSDADGGFQVEKVDSSTKFSQTSVKLSFNKNTQKNYAAGFPFYVELDVEALTTTEIENMPVKLTMISGLSDLKYVQKEIRVQNGKVFASFDVPEDACALKINAEMDMDAACEEIFVCFQPERMVAKANEFIRFLQTEPMTYSAGDTATYKVLSNRRVETLHFIILSKGAIVKSWHEVPEWQIHESGKLIAQGSTRIPSDIVTRSRLVVLTANDLSGYILADAIDLCITEELRHKINLHMNTDTARPGQNVTMFLTSDPTSFIGISVNDASLNLLREPCKVLTKEGTLSFLRDLDSGTTKDLSCEREDPYQCKSSTEVKIIDIIDLLDSEGLSIRTNMIMFDYEPPSDDRVEYNYFTEMNYEYQPVMAMASDRSYEARGDMANGVDLAADEGDSELEDSEDKSPRLRNFFPEAWLWTDVVSDENGKKVISVAAPDTITGWKGSAFGLSPDKGLGFSNEIEFQTFLPFFISLDLPYSGTVGERITIPVRLFNYLDEDVSATVRILSKIWDEQTATVNIPSNKAATVDYEISLTEAGNHEITVNARTSSGEFDAVEKSLFVQPGGEKIVDTNSILIMQKGRSTQDKTVLTVELPDGFIPGSHKLKLVAVGDILGEAVSGISSLIQLPSGCGEQNMHKVAINVFSANYITSLYEQVPENLDYNIKHNLNIGLQQQFAYRKGSGSYSQGYSVFRGGDSSDWLTAFVHKVVALFPEEVFVPCDSGLNSDRDYLLRQIRYAGNQQYTTTVNRVGWAPYQYNYHGSKDMYWNSYILISLLESDGNNRCGSTLAESSYQSDRLGKVCNATLDMAARSEDCCYHHMVAYSIQLCKDRGLLNHVDNWRRSPLRDDDKCMGSSRDGKFKFATCEENLEIESVRGSSRSIEATSYAALYFMQQERIEDTVPMIMWLAGQRNENGGFRSSQDTVMGLQALARFAELSNAVLAKRTDLTISVGMGRSYFDKFQINEDNKMSTKEVILTPEVGNYKVKWSGAGTAFVQLISSYHVIGKDYEPMFRLKAEGTVLKGLKAVRISFRLPRESGSTMYLLELASPTGMVFTKSLIEGQLQMTDGGFSAITRYDIKEGGQRLHLYLDPATKLKDIELTIPMDNKFEVFNRMPVQVSLIDYYTPSQRQTIFYSIDDLDVDETAAENTRCSVDLSCDLLQNAEAIVLGYPGEIEDDVLEIKSAHPYKVCGESFIDRLRARAKLGEASDRECVAPLMNTRSIFFLRYGENNQMEISGIASYSSVLPKITECFTVVTMCPDQ
ncbi:hypothetical protein ACHWQZ_G011458 [Mnemiopsis leidyi]